MPGVATRIRNPWTHRNLTYDYEDFKFPDQPNSSSLSDMEFGFLELYGGEQGMSGSSCNSDEVDELNNINEMVEEDGEEEGDEKNNKSSRFWENQHEAVEATLCRSSSLESRIRTATKQALKDIHRSAGLVCPCSCEKSMAQSCRNCLLREVSSRLQNAGFNSAVCRSKWKSSPDIPSGEHSFVDVIEKSRKGDRVRVIVELNLRAEFEIARASEEYNRLVQRLPEVFVGKVERLNNVIKILCLAAKKCMKEKKMHMGPWRKHRYMQAKWLKSCERNTSTQSLSVGLLPQPKPKPKASMLTVDLLDNLSNINMRRYTAVEVV